MKVAVVEKKCKESKPIYEKIKNLSNKYGFDYDEINPDIVFFVGGDGTLLRAVNKYINIIDRIEFIGINEGELGFLYDFEENDLENIFECIKNQKLSVSSHRLLKGEFDGNVVYALNEIRLENPFYTLVCNAYINDKFLEKFHGTGMLVCSTLGSSAYNKSLNGALIDHSLEILQLSEIAPIENNVYRSLGSSLVLSNGSVIRLNGTFEKAIVGYDHLYTPIEKSEELVISLSDKKVNIVRKPNTDFIDKISRSFVKWLI